MHDCPLCYMRRDIGLAPDLSSGSMVDEITFFRFFRTNEVVSLGSRDGKGDELRSQLPTASSSTGWLVGSPVLLKSCFMSLRRTSQPPEDRRVCYWF